MPRAFLCVLDSVGIGGAPDAADFGDLGANTLGHIYQACAKRTDLDPLDLANMAELGLWRALAAAGGGGAKEEDTVTPVGCWGAARELSSGKDTPSGHWELAGVVVPWEWHYFPATVPAFPDDISRAAAQAAGTEGILGNCHASGTAIVDELGAEHIKTGWPICYTSADSVFQIAAHEQAFGLERLLQMCERLAPILHARRIGRVIARPFTGSEGQFARTKNRKDFAVPPPGPTLLDWAKSAGRTTHAIGKIGDIFSMRGIDTLDTGTDETLFTHLITRAQTAPDGALIFANFVEFDSLYGHRRDIAGYARQLRWFDAQLPRLYAVLRPDDLLVLTADHGNDPTWRGTDHTREQVPVLMRGAGTGNLGKITFQDVARLVARHLSIPPNASPSVAD